MGLEERHALCSTLYVSVFTIRNGIQTRAQVNKSSESNSYYVYARVTDSASDKISLITDAPLNTYSFIIMVPPDPPKHKYSTRNKNETVEGRVTYFGMSNPYTLATMERQERQREVRRANANETIKNYNITNEHRKEEERRAKENAEANTPKKKLPIAKMTAPSTDNGGPRESG